MFGIDKIQFLKVIKEKHMILCKDAQILILDKIKFKKCTETHQINKKFMNY